MQYPKIYRYFIYFMCYCLKKASGAGKVMRENYGLHQPQAVGQVIFPKLTAELLFRGTIKTWTQESWLLVQNAFPDSSLPESMRKRMSLLSQMVQNNWFRQYKSTCCVVSLPLPYSCFCLSQLKSGASACKDTKWLHVNFPPVNYFYEHTNQGHI